MYAKTSHTLAKLVCAAGVAATLASAISTAHAADYRNTCTYGIFAKSKAIRSFRVGRMNVEFLGTSSKSSKAARRVAARTAMHCIRRSPVASRHFCEPTRRLPVGAGMAVRFPDKEPLNTGIRALCAVARRAGISTLQDVQVYAKTIAHRKADKQGCAIRRGYLYATMLRERTMRCGR